MTSGPVLDFYAPASDHRVMNKEKLMRQREVMFSWRKDCHLTTFNPKTGARQRIPNRYEMQAKQVVLPGTQREAEQLKKQRQAETVIWDGAAGLTTDKCREWKATGFTFDEEHFRTSSNPRNRYHPRNKPRVTAQALREKQKAIQMHPYKPYYHNSALISCPADGDEVFSLAVTCNKEEAIQRELHASKDAYQRRMMQKNTKESASQEPPPSWCEALGPVISSKQRNVELASAMYEDLVARQAAITGTEIGSPESLDIQIPTSEVAYSLRPEYLKTHQPTNKRVAFASTRREEEGEEEEGGEQQRAAPGASVHSDAHASLLDPSGVTSSSQTLLPTEAKGTRLYAISLKRTFNNEDSSMTRRQEPMRYGVAVDLPPSWQSPLAC